jgi:acyl-CoA synthetase (NDP forming)
MSSSLNQTRPLTSQDASLLTALLNPGSIALVGASARAGSAGDTLLKMLRVDGYIGEVFPVNPGYSSIDDLSCYPSVSALPIVPDQVVIGIANAHLEAVLDECIELGVKAITIFASGHLDQDIAPCLLQRIHDKTLAAGIALCGPNSMGFYNTGCGLRVAAFPSEAGLTRGGIAWFAQSGSAFSALTHADRRLGFALAVSTGGEITTTLSAYMIWAMTHTETRVIGIFLEGLRDIEGFRQALAMAEERLIPVVVLKVGRTALSVEMAKSHAGALAGNDAVYQALFRQYGVLQVDDLDQMAATLALFDLSPQSVKGGLATLHDSGGEREMLVDLAERHGVEFSDISDDTKSKLQAQLDPGLVAENPLDAWGTPTRFIERYTHCFDAMLADPSVALCGFFSEVRDNHSYHQGVVDAALESAIHSDKPIFIASNSVFTDDRVLALRARDKKVAIIKGTQNALVACRNFLSFANHKKIIDTPPRLAGDIQTRWIEQLGNVDNTGEAEALQLLSDYGIPSVQTITVSSAAEMAKASDLLGFPLVLKTAEDHAHKSDVGGVVLNIQQAEALNQAYLEMSKKLGPRANLMLMIPTGIEIGLGAIIDQAFGPVVVLSSGGTLIEVLDDKALALAPFGCDTARQLLSELKIYRLLEGVRGATAADIPALCDCIARFSVLVWQLRDVIKEIDVNPLIVNADGVCAVDCLVIPNPKIL